MLLARLSACFPQAALDLGVARRRLVAVNCRRSGTVAASATLFKERFEGRRSDTIACCRCSLFSWLASWQAGMVGRLVCSMSAGWPLGRQLR